MIVVVDLQNPKEKYWGALLRITPAGLWLKGLNLVTFEDWIRQFTAEEYPIDRIGLSTSFFPLHRVERVTRDEAVGEIPAYADLLAQRVGPEAAQRIFEICRARDPLAGLEADPPGSESHGP